MASAATIGTLRESSLHASLKAFYARPGDELEAAREGFVVDLARPDELVEFQTGNFASLRPKLTALLARHRVRLVHPVAAERTIVRIDGDGVVRSRRRSPVRGCHLSLFDELVSLPTLAAHPSLSFEVGLVRVEEHRLDAPRTRRRRKPWRIVDRVLVEVLEQRTLTGAPGLASVLPGSLAEPFTTADLAAELEIDRALAQRIAYTLRVAGIVGVAGRRGRAVEYRRQKCSETRPAVPGTRRVPG
jgi:hypothetical protein